MTSGQTGAESASKSDSTIKKPPSTWRRVGSYALVRILTIAITIVIGVFFAIVVANKGGGIDDAVSERLRRQATEDSWDLDIPWEERNEWIALRHEELKQENGYYDPFIIKHLRWTKDALKLELGDAIHTPLRAVYAIRQERDDIKSILLDRFPRTLILVGLADLLVFVIGIPLSLYLSRNYGGWFDKIINILSPLSSVPSWVHGVLLIMIFAVTLRLLPPGGMIDTPMPETTQGILASRLEHMILPVLAIFLSLLFQLVYSWRNYFMIYSNEDYVELAIAKGLDPSVVQNNYILKPSLPYVITSFALTLVSFWQMATALEVVFNWDGIGSLYITSLPHYWGESMFPGEVGLTIGIVVIFAYLLGLVVLLLDVAYALVDPRIRLGGQERRVRAIKYKRRRRKINAKPILTILGGLALGLLIGAVVGWGLWPIQYYHAAPSDLHPNFQTDYARMVVDSFTVNENSSLATTRMDALGEAAVPSLQGLIEDSENDTALKSALQNFASSFRPDGSAVEMTGGEGQNAKSSLFSRLGIAFLIVVLAAILIGGVVYLYLWWTSRPPKKPKAARQKDTAQRNHKSRLVIILQDMVRYPTAVIGLAILLIMISGSVYAVIRYPYKDVGMRWYTDAYENTHYVPRLAYPKWVNFFRLNDYPETIVVDSRITPEIKSVKYTDSGNPDYTVNLSFEYPYTEFPGEAVLYFDVEYDEKQPFSTFVWTTPDGREYSLANGAIEVGERYRIDEHIDMRELRDHPFKYENSDGIDPDKVPILNGLFLDPTISREMMAVPGTYNLEIKTLGFEPDTQMDVELVVMGQVYGAAGTDFFRRDLVVPLLWGMPFALGIGLGGALLTTIVSMLFAAFGVWFGGWADALVQRITEANMILPVVAIAVLFYAFYGASLWTILAVIVVLNAFGSPTKTFRAAFMQIKDAGYIEAAQAYGAPNRRIIFHYMIPRILPVLIPQLVTLIPGFIFLEATLGMFNVKSILPTWGKVIYEALSKGAAWGSKFWVLEPIALLLLTGFAFSLMGFALDRVLNPRLQQGD